MKRFKQNVEALNIEVQESLYYTKMMSGKDIMHKFRISKTIKDQKGWTWLYLRCTKCGYPNKVRADRVPRTPEAEMKPCPGPGFWNWRNDEIPK